jgi:hypothetical protein
MAYSSSDIPTIGKKNERRSKYSIADNSSSNFLDLDSNLKPEGMKVNRTFTKPYHNTTQEEVLSTKKVEKKHKCEFTKYSIRSKKKVNQEELVQSINQFNPSEVFNTIPYNNAPPIKVTSTDVRSCIRRGETILMVWHCFFSLIRNVFSNLSSQFSKRSKQLISDGFESEKEYHKSREIRSRIFWKKLVIKWKSLIRGILFGGGKRGYQPYDWESWISDLVEGNYHSSSNQLKAVGFFSTDIGALSMSSNLQGLNDPYGLLKF